MAEPSGEKIDRAFVTHGERLLRTARRLLDSEEDAEDAVQEVFVALLRGPHVLADIESLGAWLVTLLKRRCADLLRKSSRAPEQSAGDLAELLPEDDEPAKREDLAEALRAALGALPEELRYAFVENEIYGKSFREIANESGVPMGTLMARKQKAVALLHKSLRDAGD